MRSCEVTRNNTRKQVSGLGARNKNSEALGTLDNSCSINNDDRASKGNIRASVLTYVILGVPYYIYTIKDPQTLV